MPPAERALADRPRTELYAGLAALYHSRDYSDLVLFGKDGGRHPVHRAIVCPRSSFIEAQVKEGQWRQSDEAHIAVPDDDEVLHLLVEYFYLLDYHPIVNGAPPDEDASSRADSSDTMSVRTEPGNYGHVYGASAVSAFGGPAHGSQPSMHSTVFRTRNDSTLTVHALPSTVADFASYGVVAPRMQPRRTTSRGIINPTPDPSPLATKEPNLTLHARLYAAAYRYGVDGLKALSLDKFKIQLTRHWNSPELAEAIAIVYNSTPSTEKGMREAVADVLGWHGELLDRPEIEVAIVEINGLAFELLKRSRRAEPEYMG